MAVTALVGLDEVLAELNMTQLPPDGGVELQGFIDDAQPVIEDLVGHVVAATFDEFYDGGDVCIFLRETPVLSVATVNEVIGLTGYTLTDQPVGQPVDNFGFTVDARTGRLTRRSAGSTPYPFYDNTANIEVVYTAGRASVPRGVRMATLELIRGWYQQGQQAYGKAAAYEPGAGADDSTGYSSTPSGYLVSNRVKSMCNAELRPIVFA